MNVRKCSPENVTTYDFRVRPICKYTMDRGVTLQLYCDKAYNFTLPVVKTQSLLERKFSFLRCLHQVLHAPLLTTRC